MTTIEKVSRDYKRMMMDKAGLYASSAHHRSRGFIRGFYAATEMLKTPDAKGFELDVGLNPGTFEIAANYLKYIAEKEIE